MYIFCLKILLPKGSHHACRYMSVSIQGNLGKTKISNLKDRRELVTQYKQTSPKYSAKLHTCNALMKNTYIRKDKLYMHLYLCFKLEIKQYVCRLDITVDDFRITCKLYMNVLYILNSYTYFFIPYI